MQPSALTTLGYMLTAISFMFGIQLLRSPATARQGNRVAAVGMLLVLGITLLAVGVLVAVAVGVGFGVPDPYLSTRLLPASAI